MMHALEKFTAPLSGGAGSLILQNSWWPMCHVHYKEEVLWKSRGGERASGRGGLEKRPGQGSRKWTGHWRRYSLWLLQLRKMVLRERWWCHVDNSRSRYKLSNRWIKWQGPTLCPGMGDSPVESRPIRVRDSAPLGRAPWVLASPWRLWGNGHYLWGNNESLRMTCREGHDEINFWGDKSSSDVQEAHIS